MQNPSSVDTMGFSAETSGCQECRILQREFEKNPGGKTMSRAGLAFVAVTGGAALALSAICLPFVTPALRRVCLPFVPATNEQVQNVVRALLREGRSGGGGGATLVDIGSGDGRIVFEAARHGFKSHGIELNPWLVLYSKFRAFRTSTMNATFSRQDLWKADLRPFQNVVIFGVGEMMPELERKLESEASKGTLVVACRFPFPTWKAEETIGEGIDAVWLYRPKGG